MTKFLKARVSILPTIKKDTVYKIGIIANQEPKRPSTALHMQDHLTTSETHDTTTPNVRIAKAQ